MTLCIYVNMVQFPNIIIIPMTKNKGKNIMLSDYGCWLWKIQKSDDSNIIIHNSESRWIQNYGLWESSKFQISRNRIRISNFRIMDLEKTVFGFIISSEPLARMLVLCFRRRRLSLPCRSATSSLCSGVRCSSWTLPLVNTKHGQL
jgi:hypothetical protein